MDQPAAPPLILVAEDDLSNSEVIASTLTDFGGYRVVTEADGEQVMRRIDEAQPDLLLLDLLLPNRSGLEILRELRHHPRFAALPIIAISADVRPGIGEQARALGCREFIAKPFGIDQLLDSVAHALTARPETRDNG
ncbi:MAG: response regulator [Sphaerobacter sp.]|nr:response regulator [Sphaerobacter sp.]